MTGTVPPPTSGSKVRHRTARAFFGDLVELRTHATPAVAGRLKTAALRINLNQRQRQNRPTTKRVGRYKINGKGWPLKSRLILKEMSSALKKGLDVKHIEIVASHA